MVTVTEIQDFLSKQETDDPVKKKSKYRVTRALAENVKANNPLPEGRCNLCGRIEERLIPVTMKICISCCNKFIQRGGGLRIIRKNNEEYFCDNCMARSFINFYVNPVICQICANKIGKTHRMEREELQENIQKSQQQRPGGNLQ